MILLGSVLRVEVAWSIGDVFNGMMAFTNMIGIFGLAGLAVAEVNGYMARIKSKSTEHR